MDYQKLFNYMSQEHGVTLMESDMKEIRNIVLGAPKQGQTLPLDSVSVSCLQRYEVNVSGDSYKLLKESSIGGLVLWDDIKHLLNSR